MTNHNDQTNLKFKMRMIKTAWLLAIGLMMAAGGGLARAAMADDAAKEIEAVLSRQAEAWNRGDIDGFMEHYWKSDELTFSSGGQTTRGWKSTQENYQRRYPTREKMGRLTFSELEVTSLGDSAALVLGRWKLARDESPVGGNFSLVCRKMDGKWVIVHDHTSKGETP